MRRVPESAYPQRAEQFGAEDYMRPQNSGGAKIQLIVALLGLGTLGFMLWTIAKLLNLIPG